MIDAFLSGIFLLSALGILGGLFFLLGKLRAGHRAPVRPQPDGGTGATVAAGLVLVALFGAAVALFVDRPADSQPAFVVKLTGYQFGWRFEYFEGDQQRSLGVTTTDHLVLPRGVEIDILATSSDVIHRLEVPELNVRRDLIPGLVSNFRVRAPRNGSFIVQSDGLCGASVGLMAAKLSVVDPATFRAWLNEQ